MKNLLLLLTLTLNSGLSFSQDGTTRVGSATEDGESFPYTTEHPSTGVTSIDMGRCFMLDGGVIQLQYFPRRNENSYDCHYEAKVRIYRAINLYSQENFLDRIYTIDTLNVPAQARRYAGNTFHMIAGSSWEHNFVKHENCRNFRSRDELYDYLSHVEILVLTGTGRYAETLIPACRFLQRNNDGDL